MSLPKHLRSDPVADKGRWTARAQLEHFVEAALTGEPDAIEAALVSSIQFLKESR